ncbi:MAG: ATP-dependent helicase, partial [Betaproteobacteria bacterium]
HGKPHPRPAAAPLPGGFDFSKPYEAKSATDAPAAAASHTRHAGARAKGPTAALLGGTAKKS